MAQVIGTNVASLNAQRNLNASQSDLHTSLERLSSGMRINSAKDDAAGLAISTRFTTQINGLNQAVRNANDGISLAQTAEGALGTSGESLQRIRQLALQSANSTNSSSDREALNAEVQQLLSEVDRVGQTTQFNGTNVLDGSFSAAQFQVGANANQTINFSVSGATTNTLGAYQAESTAVTANAFDGSGFTINGAEIGVSTATSAAGVTAESAAAKATAINSKSSETGVTATADTTVTSSDVPVANNSLANGELLVNGVAVGSIAASTDAVTQGRNARDAINAVSTQTGVVASTDAATGALTLDASDGRDITLTTNGTDAATRIAATQNVLEATGLDLSDGVVTNAASNESATLTLAANNVGAAGGIVNGDTITVGGKVFEFNVDGAAATGSNTSIALSAGDTAADAATALRTALSDATFTNGPISVGGTGTSITLGAQSSGPNTIAAGGSIAEGVGQASAGNAGTIVPSTTTTGVAATAEVRTIQIANGGVEAGDSITVGGQRFEYTTGGAAASSGIAVDVNNLKDENAVATALQAAIAGSSVNTSTATSTVATDTVTLTAVTEGAAGFTLTKTEAAGSVAVNDNIAVAETQAAGALQPEISTVTLSGPTRAGDTITVDGTVFEFTVGGAAAEAGNIAVNVATEADLADNDARTAALTTAFNSGPAALAQTAVDTGGGVVTLTGDVDNVSFALTDDESVGAQGNTDISGVTAGTDVTAQVQDLTFSGQPVDGDIIDINGSKFEFVTGDANKAASGNIGVVIGGSVNDTTAALRTAISGSSLSTELSVGGANAVVTLTEATSGASDTSVNSVTIGETPAVASTSGAITSSLTAGVTGTQADDVDGVTTRGTMTLNSASNFTVGGADIAYSGLNGVAPELAQLNTVDISTVQGANDAIAVLDGALSQVNTIRADLGAIQNRFESTISSLSTTTENLSAARSRILDTDFAAETASMTRSTILQQAGISILSQANSLPQQVLSLLQ